MKIYQSHVGLHASMTGSCGGGAGGADVLGDLATGKVAIRSMSSRLSKLISLSACMLILVLLQR